MGDSNGPPAGYDAGAVNLRQPDVPVEMKVFQGGGGGGEAIVAQDSLLAQPESPVEMKVFHGGGSSPAPEQHGGSVQWAQAFGAHEAEYKNTKYYARAAKTQPQVWAALYIWAEDTGRVLLFKRGDTKTIGGPGGGIDTTQKGKKESGWFAALREADEEAGFLKGIFSTPELSHEEWEILADCLEADGSLPILIAAEFKKKGYPSLDEALMNKLIQVSGILTNLQKDVFPIYAGNGAVYVYRVSNETHSYSPYKSYANEVDATYDWSDFAGTDINKKGNGFAFIDPKEAIEHIRKNYTPKTVTDVNAQRKQAIVLKSLLLMDTIASEATAAVMDSKMFPLAKLNTLQELMDYGGLPAAAGAGGTPSPGAPNPPGAPGSAEGPPAEFLNVLQAATFRGLPLPQILKNTSYTALVPILIPTPAFKDTWLTVPFSIPFEGSSVIVAPLEKGPQTMLLFHPNGGELTKDSFTDLVKGVKEEFVLTFGTPLITPSATIFGADATPIPLPGTLPSGGVGAVGGQGGPGGASKPRSPRVIDNKTPTITLSNGITVRFMEIGDPLKQDILDLKFTEDEDYLFTKVLKFRKPWILSWIASDPKHQEDFYKFWKIYVNKDGTDVLSLSTSREKQHIGNFLQEMLADYRKMLHERTWDWLKRKHPDNYEDYEEDASDGFFFVTLKSSGSSVPAAGGTPPPAGGTPPGAGGALPPAAGGAPPPGSGPVRPPTRPHRKGARERQVEFMAQIKKDLGIQEESSEEEINSSNEYQPEQDETLPELTPGEKAAAKKPTLTPEQEAKAYLDNLVKLVNAVRELTLKPEEYVEEILRILVPAEAEVKQDIEEALSVYEPTETLPPVDAKKWKPSTRGDYVDISKILNDLVSLDPKTLTQESTPLFTQFRDYFPKIHPPSAAVQRQYARTQQATTAATTAASAGQKQQEEFIAAGVKRLAAAEQAAADAKKEAAKAQAKAQRAVRQVVAQVKKGAPAAAAAAPAAAPGEPAPTRTAAARATAPLGAAAAAKAARERKKTPVGAQFAANQAARRATRPTPGARAAAKITKTAAAAAAIGRSTEEPEANSEGDDANTESEGSPARPTVRGRTGAARGRGTLRGRGAARARGGAAGGQAPPQPPPATSESNSDSGAETGKIYKGGSRKGKQTRRKNRNKNISASSSQSRGRTSRKAHSK